MAMEDMQALLEEEQSQDWGLAEDEGLYQEEEPPSRLQRLTGTLTPLQWFLLSFLLFLSLCTFSLVFLLFTGRMAL